MEERVNKDSKKILDVWQDSESKDLNKHVLIDGTRLVEIAEKHACDTFEIPNWRFVDIYPNYEWAFAGTQLLANCFNFAFNLFEKPDAKYTVLNPVYGMRPFTGAFAMDRKIYSWLGESIPHAKYIRQAFGTLQKTTEFFRDMTDIPFPELRYECAMDFYENLSVWYFGNPLNILEEAMVWDERLHRSVLRAFNNGNGLVELLVSKFPIAYGADVQNLNGQSMPFNKRAMLVAVMIHDRALDSRGILPPVIDIEEVGPIADYELPKALRHMGIFHYSDIVAGLVDNWQEIAKGSQTEVEIRAATVVACDALLKHMNILREASRLERVNICHLDYWLWKMGKNATNIRPHLTKTSAY